MKNILITGGAGFIGSNLALKLIDKGYRVRVLDNLSPQIHGNFPEKTSPLFKNIINKVEFINGSVTSRTDWLKGIDHQDAIIHLAAETGTGQSMYEIYNYVNVNISGTALMLDILANEKHTIKRILVASSRAIYGEGKYICDAHGFVYPEARKDSDMQKKDFSCKCPICNSDVELVATTEDSKIHPTSIYGITKQNQEQMVLLMGKALNIPAIAFRYQNVYGPGQSLSNPYTGILSIFSTLILNNKTINIFEDGNESRDFVYIDDVIDATILGLEKNSVNSGVYNVGTGISTSVKSVFEILLKYYQFKSNFEITGNYRLGDIRHNFADINLIKKDLDFTPKINIEDGIRKFTHWVINQNITASGYEKSINEMKAKKLLK